MEFLILGPLEARDGGRKMPLGGARQRALLALLLLHANEVVSSDRLIDELWAEAGLRDPAGTLSVAVARLRRALAPAPSAGGNGELLITRPPGYELRLSPGQLDLHRFEALTEEARTAPDPATSAAKLSDALALWRGPALADLAYEPFCQAEISRLEELRLAALEDRLRAELELGRHAEVVGELEALVGEHPLRERMRELQMLALYRSGRQAEALEAYRAARVALTEELGIEPGRELRELHQAILEQSSDLDLAPPDVVPAAAPTGAFVGRDAELAALAGALDDALAGEGRLVLLAGEPGIGKSQLAEELMARARARGARVLVGRCWEAGGAPAYWPWVQALRRCLREGDAETVRSWVEPGAGQLATILPELRELVPDVSDPPAADSGSARFRLFESVTSFLTSAASTRPLALFFDDLHASDASSLLLLRFVAEELGAAPILVVGCYRDTEIGPDLADVLPELSRATSVKRVALKGLGRSDTARLLELTTGHAPRAELAAKVHEETEGNPLFAGEVARLLASEGNLEHADRLPVPEGVREAISRRLQRTSDGCRHVLNLASVLGREFDVDALERVSGLEQDELFVTLEEAMEARLVGEVPDGGGRLRFAHVLIRDSLYEDLPATRRLRLHRELGEALEALYASNLEPHGAELAHHYLLAGAPSAPKAVRYAEAAGDRAASQLAYEEAARHYQSALRVLETRGPADERKTCDLLLALGDALSRAGRGSDAKEALRRAAAIAEREGWPDRLAPAALGYGGRFGWARGSIDPAFVPLLERALSAVGEGDSPARVRLLARLAAARRDDASREGRICLADEAVSIATRIGDPATLAYALEGRFVAVEGPDSADELITVGEQLTSLAEQIGDKELAFAAHDHRMNALWSLAERAAVDVELASLSTLADDLRQPPQRWALGTSRTMLALMEGEFERAEQLISETRALGQRAESWNALVSERLALFVLRRAQCRLAELEEPIGRSVHEYPALLRFRCALAHLYAELGRERDARAALDDLLSRDLAHEHVDAEWLFTMSLLADPCAFLDDRAGALKLYSLLTPYGHRYAEAPVEATFGSIARGLGVLATTLRRFDDAERHFATAIEIEQRMRARPWLAHARHDLATMLLARDGSGDREKAGDLLGEAIGTYRELGMEHWAERAATLQPSALRR